MWDWIYIMRLNKVIWNWFELLDLINILQMIQIDETEVVPHLQVYY